MEKEERDEEGTLVPINVPSYKELNLSDVGKEQTDQRSGIKNPEIDSWALRTLHIANAAFQIIRKRLLDSKCMMTYFEQINLES